MNKYISNSLKKLIILLIILIISFGIAIVCCIKDDYFKDISNSCKVLVADELNNIINNEVSDYKYNYTIISLDGSVIKTTEEEMPSKLSLNNITFNNWYEIEDKDLIRYCTSLIHNEKIEGVIIFSIPKDDIIEFRNERKNKIYVIILAVISLGLITVIYKISRLINKDILIPINCMHNSAKEILKGNFSEKVSYDYCGEIGEFSHDFESMRESLILSSKKEKELKIAEKELLASISHDLKTPIANILGYCEGIRDGVVKEEEDVKRYVSIILKKANVLNKLLGDILELSKAEINQMTIKKKYIYSKEFFEDLLEEMSMDVYSSGRKLILDTEIPNILINLDEEKITQVFNNIISNAVKYTKEDGVINVAFKKINNGIEVLVKDNGIGIAEEEIPLVFKKFYRSEKHRNQNIPGSGLGLAIAKYIVEKHNGSIKIISEKDKGTIVSFKVVNSEENIVKNDG